MVFLLGNEVQNGPCIDLLESSNALGDDSHSDGERDRQSVRQIFRRTDLKSYIRTDRNVSIEPFNATEGPPYRRSNNYKQKDKYTDIHSKRQKDRHSVRQIFKNKDGQTEKYTSRQIYRWTDTGTDIQSDRHSEKPNDSHTITQIFRRTEEETNSLTNI